MDLSDPEDDHGRVGFLEDCESRYLRKKDLFSQYTTNQLENLQEAALIWPASSSEGMVNEELLRTITERVGLLNK